MSCQGCGWLFLKTVVDLGEQPICNRNLTLQTETEKRYPLRLAFCPKCSLVQLGYVPPVSEVFGRGFNYLSGSSASVKKHYQQLAAQLADRYLLRGNDLVFDIASNDGTFLKGLQEMGIRVVGLDPCPLPAKIARENGVPTFIQRFESFDERIRPTLITAFDVMAHTPTIHDFLRTLKSLLFHTKADFVCQSQYLPAMIEKGEWDTIYHEHARFYTVSTLTKLLNGYGIGARSVEFNDFYGGSFILHCRAGVPNGSEVNAAIKREAPYSSFETYEPFAERVRRNRADLLSSLDGGRIAGIGAPMKSATLLNYCGLDFRRIEYLTESNPLKVGTFAPGSRIPIKDDSYFFSHPPDAALILSWNMADFLIEKYRERGYQGPFIVPIPEVRIVR